MKFFQNDNKIAFIVPYNNEQILNKWFKKSQINDSEVKTISIPSDSSAPQELNKNIENFPNKWLVFCEQGVRFHKDVASFLENKNKDVVYGIIGASLKKSENKIHIVDGRTGHPGNDEKEVDSLGQGCIIIHSSIFKKFNCKFDERFHHVYMSELSLYCKSKGLKVAILPIPSLFRDQIINLQDIENYNKILREKYSNILPIGLWWGILSAEPYDDLKSYTELRDEWIKLLIRDKAEINSKLRQQEQIMEEIRKNEGMIGTDNPESVALEKYNENLEKKLVWVCGTPRSGSTWLASNILRRKGIRMIDELMIGAQVGAFLDNPQVHWNIFQGKYKARYTRIVDAVRDDLFFSSKYEEKWIKSLRNFVLSRISAQFGYSGYDHIVLKSPNESHGSDVLLKCFPNSKLIFLIRDGRDVIDSRQSKFQNPRKGARGPETPEERKFRIGHFSMMWNIMIETTQKAYENHDPDLRILVKYEDLRQESEREIKRIFEFLGYHLSEDEIKEIADLTSFENVPSEMKGEDKNIRKAKPGGFHDYFSDEEIKIMNKIMGENLTKFGYKL